MERTMVNRQLNQIQRSVLKLRAGSANERPDVVAAEEPLEVRLQWQDAAGLNLKSIAVTMRTPGDDFDLAMGFLYGEGIIDRREDIADVAYCLDLDVDEEQRRNIVTVTLAPGLEFDLSRLERNFYTTSSCGVCGKATLEALEVQGCDVLGPGLEVGFETICALPRTLRNAQEVFETTGGLHAAGLFASDGELIALDEDVGRHNAMDKLVGGQLFAGNLPLEHGVLLLSGRCSFELVQKALRARIPVVASVGAPSSLAVDVAESFGMTLCGFVRPDGFNVYTGAQRVRS
jgi:FdhD protein